MQNTFLIAYGDRVFDKLVHAYDPNRDNWDEVFEFEIDHYFGNGFMMPNDFYAFCDGDNDGEDDRSAVFKGKKKNKNKKGGKTGKLKYTLKND